MASSGTFGESKGRLNRKSSENDAVGSSLSQSSLVELQSVASMGAVGVAKSRFVDLHKRKQREADAKLKLAGTGFEKVRPGPYSSTTLQPKRSLFCHSMVPPARARSRAPVSSLTAFASPPPALELCQPSSAKKGARAHDVPG